MAYNEIYGYFCAIGAYNSRELLQMEMKFKHLSSPDFDLPPNWMQLDKEHEFSGLPNSSPGIKNGQPTAKKEPIHVFVIYSDNTPLGYIQYYNAYDFLKDGYKPEKLPKSLAAIEMFMKKDNKNIAQKALESFLESKVFKEFNYVLADLDINNLEDISCFEKSGFSELKLLNGRILMVASKRIVRIHTLDAIAIELAFRKHWLPNDSIWIFGSRADLSRKGGDIDIYIETHAKSVEQAFNMREEFVIALNEQIGEQKIDVVLNMVNFSDKLPIYEVAKSEGVKII